MRWMDMGPFTVCNVGLVCCARDWNDLMLEEDLGPHAFPDGPETTWFEDAADGPLVIVCMPGVRRMDRREAIGYCVHEAVHCWQYICDYIRAGKTGREIEAYSVQWISGWLIKELRL